MINFLLFLIIIYLAIEIIFFFLINYLRSEIPWIITEKDEFPKFDKKKVKNFFKKTFDIQLGWDWKPNTKHKEIIFSRVNKIYFGKLGERKGLKTEKKLKYNFASFGDSFVFCRFVKNRETWQEQISNHKASRGLNLGVGNYGLDQAYIKYLRTKLPKNVKTIFIGFVPETLSRCLCSWKHYHEFKNIYAFKPKFINHKADLKLLKNPIEDIRSFNQIKNIIKKIRPSEFFYKKKFLLNKIRYPFFFSILKRPSYNAKLIFYSILKILNLNHNKIIELIIKKNSVKNDIYFSSKKNNQLIKKLMIKINQVAKTRKQKITFLVFPQKHDLNLKNKNYHKFFLNLKKELNIIDFTNIFEIEDKDKIYLPGKYGGHLTAYGNKIVAKTIIEKGIL